MFFNCMLVDSESCKPGVLGLCVSKVSNIKLVDLLRSSSEPNAKSSYKSTKNQQEIQMT